MVSRAKLQVSGAKPAVPTGETVSFKAYNKEFQAVELTVSKDGTKGYRA